MQIALKAIYQIKTVELAQQIDRGNELKSTESERLNVTSSFRKIKTKTNHFLDRHRGAKQQTNEKTCLTT